MGILKLGASTLSELLNFDSSVYVLMGTSADASLNKIIKFNLYIDSTSGHISYEQLVVINKNTNEDHLFVVFDSLGRISISTSQTSYPASYYNYNVTSDMVNKILRCEIAKAEHTIKWFKVNDISITNSGTGIGSAGGSTSIGTTLKYATVWDVQLYDYDSSLFTTGTLKNSWKGYPRGNTDAAWTDAIGGANGQITFSNGATAATTRNISGVSELGYSKLKLNSGGPISVGNFDGINTHFVNISPSPIPTLELTKQYQTIVQFKLWLDKDTGYRNQGFIFNTSSNFDANCVAMVLKDSSIFFTQSVAYKDYSILGKSNQVLNCEIFKKYADATIGYFKINGVEQTPGVLSVGASATYSAAIIGEAGFSFLSFTPNDLSTLGDATIWDIKMIEASTGTVFHYWKGYPDGSTSAAWIDQVGALNGASSLSGSRTINAVGSGVGNKLKLTSVSNTRATYGLLYNRYAATDASGLAPSGWRVPTVADLSTLVTNVGGDPNIAGGKLKEIGLAHWASPNSGATDDYGFSLLGAGWRDGLSDGSFSSLKSNTYLMVQSGTAYRYFTYNSSAAGLNIGNAKEGNPVRCVRDTNPGSSTVTDYDGNIYDVIQIGSQYWLKQNLKVTHYNDGTVIPNVTNGATWIGLTTGALCAYNNDWNNV